MRNREPIPLKRKLMLVALTGGVGLSFAAIIVSFAVNAVGSPNTAVQPTLPPPSDSPAFQQAPPLMDGPAGQTRQSTFEFPGEPSLMQDVELELQLVGILPIPGIVQLDNPGDSMQLSVKGYYSDGSVGQLDVIDGMDFTYRSSDPSVAEVSLVGVVTAFEKGGADVEVGYGDFTATVTVFVWSTKLIPR